MILVCERCSEERLDSIAHHLIDRAPIPVNSFHHPLKDGVEKPTGLLRITVGDVFRGSLYVCGKYSDLFSLTF
jgi:hypothetical protein